MNLMHGFSHIYALKVINQHMSVFTVLYKTLNKASSRPAVFHAFSLFNRPCTSARLAQPDYTSYGISAVMQGVLWVF